MTYLFFVQTSKDKIKDQCDCLPFFAVNGRSHQFNEKH